MQIIPPSAAADSPADYLDQLYLELPRLFTEGGTQAEVDTIFGGLSAAFEGALDVPFGVDLDIRMFPLPWGWVPDYDGDRDVGFDLVEAGVDLGDPRPDFRVGDGCGLLFVPATSEPGWQRWSPTQGRAPKPKDGHILVTLVLLRDGREGATVCQIREVYGRDKSLRGPLYKPAIRLAPANNAESARLLDTLRALLAGGEAA
jgi:hypothetical protein